MRKKTSAKLTDCSAEKADAFRWALKGRRSDPPSSPNARYPAAMVLLTPDMRGWLPEGHLTHHVSDLLGEPDLTVFHTPYEGNGRRNAPYEPRMMVTVLPYGYATGVFPSRGIARRPEEDIAFRVLGAGNLPSRRTL